MGIALVFLAGCASANIQPTIPPNSYGQSGSAPYAQVDQQPRHSITITAMNNEIAQLAQEVCPITQCEPNQILSQVQVLNAPSESGNMAETDDKNRITFYLSDPRYSDPSISSDTIKSAIVEELTHGSTIIRNVTVKDGFKDGTIKGFNYNYSGINADEQMVDLASEEISTRAIDLQISPKYSNPDFDKGGRLFSDFLLERKISAKMLSDFHHRSTPDALVKALGMKDTMAGYRALTLTMWAMNLEKPDKLFGKTIQQIYTIPEANKFLSTAYGSFGGK